MLNTGVERDEDGLTYEEQRKETERGYQALKAENARLRAALAFLLDNTNEESFDHKEAVRRAQELLGPYSPAPCYSPEEQENRERIRRELP